MHLPIAGLVLATACLYGADASLRMHKRVYEYPSHVPVHSGSFIVEFEDHQVHTHAENLNALSSVSVHKRFTKGFHGAVVATSKDLNPEMLAQVPGVKRIWRNRKHSLTTRKEKREIKSPFLHQMTGVAQAMQEFGLDGTGVKIGIVDTGVDYNHPELGACWKTEGCPWQFGEDFIGDKYDYYSDNPIIEPNDTPTDCDGHGTHVSGIIGARGPQVQGVAPGATLGMYRIFSCPVNDTTYTDDAIILQGMTAAYEDGCDIISLSLGSGGWAEDPISVLGSKLVDEGVLVIAANGNEGNDGMLSSCSPAVGKGVIGVGSVDNWNFTKTSTAITTPDGDRHVRISSPATNGVPFTFNTSTPLIIASDETGNTFGCNKTDTDYSGSVVVTRIGECMISDKAFFAQSQGAVGLIVIDTDTIMYSIYLLSNVTIPCVHVLSDDGDYIINGITAGASTVITNETEYVNFANLYGGQMSDYSSLGPTPELELTPLVSAPGGYIWSTYPVEMGSYKSMSGTSMATPYVAGCVALLKQKFPNMSVSQIRQVLINSASPLSDPTSRLKINPYRSGAGLVNVYNALRTRVLIDPPYLSINQTAWTQPSDSTDATTQGVRISTHMLNFTNTDLKKGVNVILTHDAASSLTVYDKDGSYSQSILDNYIVPTWPNNTTPVPQNTIPQAILSNEAQYVPAGQTMQFNVSIILPFGLAESERWYFGGFFNFTIMFDHEDYTMQHVVPYAGYNGDFSKINVLSPLSMGLPAFMDSEGNFIEDISTVKFDSENSTYLAFGLDVPTSFLYSVFIDSKNETVGYAADGNGVYLPRTLPTYDPYFTFTVNKTILAGDDFSQSAILPDGKYRLRIAVLRPFGDAGNEDDFEMWDSDEITFGE